MKTLLTWLGFDAQKHSVKVEMMAGLTTFLTMSYILAVNPIILGDAGMEKGAVFSATVIAAVVATMVIHVAGGSCRRTTGGYLLYSPDGSEDPRGDCQLHPFEHPLLHLSRYRFVYRFHRTEEWWYHRRQ